MNPAAAKSRIFHAKLTGLALSEMSTDQQMNPIAEVTVRKDRPQSYITKIKM